MADTTIRRSGRNADAKYPRPQLFNQRPWPHGSPARGAQVVGGRRLRSVARRLVTAATLLLCASFAYGNEGPGTAAEPRVLLNGCMLERIASNPDIATPIGVAFDARGRLLVVESHTHHRPDGYAGPAGDRIRMLADSDGDCKLDAWTTFAEGFQQGANILVRADGGVYVVTRNDVRLLEDADGSGAADKQTTILRLETDTDYPHNGLSGIAYSPAHDGGAAQLYIGLGENFGAAYKLIGSDGSAYSDRGGAGTVFRCDSDGAALRRYATGFWNPFALCVAASNLFCVDNDPDASPPCRLIDVLPAGDYGYRYEYFRPGTHPLQCWNGELPGTLPMICGTGEAPTAVVFHRGYLWVTSWGDHRIERYELALKPDGHYTATRTTVVQGGEDFRPTGMAVAPDGSLYFGDWVKLDYSVHGQGRIWRLSLPDESNAQNAVTSVKAERKPVKKQELLYLAAQSDATTPPGSNQPEVDLRYLQAARWRRTPSDAMLRAALRGADADIRLYAVRWIAEERIKSLRDDIADLLDGEIPSERYFLAVLAALDWLDGNGEMKPVPVSDQLLLRDLQNPSRSPQLHALALRLISPDDGWLTSERMALYLQNESTAVRQAAVQTLGLQTRPERLPLLARIATDESQAPNLRADAVAGLAGAAAEYALLLQRLACDPAPQVAAEASRVLRLTSSSREADDDSPPSADLEAWQQLLATGGDADAGRRQFFMAAGPRCAICHQHSGRGGRVGPDLTLIGRQQSRERIIASVLQPSREVAPEYQPWALVTYEGLAKLGLRMPEAGDDGEEIYVDESGHPFHLSSDEIEIREPSDKSIMPDGLEQTLSIGDLRDIVAFLSQQN